MSKPHYHGVMSKGPVSIDECIHVIKSNTKLCRQSCSILASVL